MNTTANSIIDALGGTTATARLLGAKPPSVDGWRRADGIPQLRLLQIQKLRPDLLAGVDMKSLASGRWIPI